MKIFYVPFKKPVFLIGLIIIITLFLLLSLGIKKTINTFNSHLENPIYKGNENLNKIALECNVVWGTEYIPNMINILKEHDIKITFFIGGEWARDNPNMLKLISREGHEIGNHGFSHKHHSKLSFEEDIDEIKNTEKIINEITGITTCLFAPPYGEFDQTTLRAASSNNYKTIMWSIDTIDWRGDGVEAITDRVLKNHHNGAFILIHPTEDTIKALPTIIKGLKEKGYEIGTISELLQD